MAWKAFHQQLPYPSPKGPGAFGDLPPTRSQMKRSKVVALPVAGGAPAPAPAAVGGGGRAATDEEVYAHWLTLKRLVDTRFSEMRRAFRLIDEDNSGECDRDEADRRRSGAVGEPWRPLPQLQLLSRKFTTPQFLIIYYDG